MLNDLLFDIERDLCRRPGFWMFLKYFLFKRSFQTVFLYRLRHLLSKKKYLCKLNIVLDWLSFFLTSCDIHASAKIGRGAYFPHPVGIVIGKGCIIFDNVTIYQNVTLGRRSVNIPEYPTVHSSSTLCCGAVILGKVEIGGNTIIGANSVIAHNCEPNSTYAGVPGRKLKNA